MAKSGMERSAIDNFSSTKSWKDLKRTGKNNSILFTSTALCTEFLTQKTEVFRVWKIPFEFVAFHNLVIF